MRYYLNSRVVALRSVYFRDFKCRGLSTAKRDKYYVYRTLGLETFSDPELRRSYREVFSRDSQGDLVTGLKVLIDKKDKTIEGEDELHRSAEQVAAYLMAKSSPRKKSFSMFRWLAAPKADEKEEKVAPPDSSEKRSLSFDDFKARLRSSAEELDSKIPEVAASAVLTGTSIGIIIPCMPILVQTIGMPPSEFGIVIAAFGIAKMIGNLPSAYFVDNYGRKPVMVAGLTLCGIGIGGIGLTLIDGFGTPWLIGCRLVSGLGVSAFTAGTIMLLSDISTPLNRTRTNASVMAGFQGGTALGPALGGLMVSSLGVGPTYFTVGGCFAVMASLQHMFLKETLPGKTLYQKMADEKKNEERQLKTRLLNTIQTPSSAAVVIPKARPGILGSFKVALLSWKELLKKPAVRDVMMLHSAYWVALAGSQMTLLPLMMVGPALHLSASDIGWTFAFMAVTSVAASQPVAYLADRHGKINCMVGGCGLVASAMFLLPHADSYYTVLLATVPLALGSTTMSAPPLALISDMVTTEDRAQAQALLRTSGDVGLLVGATAGGLIADVYSIESAISGYGALLAGSTMCFAIRTIGLKGLLSLSFNQQTTDTIKDKEGYVESQKPEPVEKERGDSALARDLKHAVPLHVKSSSSTVAVDATTVSHPITEIHAEKVSARSNL
jgi:MFS family permease